MQRNSITATQFRDWVAHADDESLEQFIDLTLDTILELEQDDFFGTEGIGKRFA